MPSDIAQTEQKVTEVNDKRLPGKSTFYRQSNKMADHH